MSHDLGSQIIVVSYSFGLTLLTTVAAVLGRSLLNKIKALDQAARKEERRARRHRGKQDRALRSSVEALKLMTERSREDGGRLERLERGHQTLRDAVTGLTTEMEALSRYMSERRPPRTRGAPAGRDTPD